MSWSADAERDGPPTGFFAVKWRSPASMQGSADYAEDYGELRIFKRRICDLIAEVTSDVPWISPRANILIYRPSRGLRLVLEAAQECANDTLLEVRARILGDDLPSQLSRKLVITLSKTSSPTPV